MHVEESINILVPHRKAGGEQQIAMLHIFPYNVTHIFKMFMSISHKNCLTIDRNLIFCPMAIHGRQFDIFY